MFKEGRPYEHLTINEKQKEEAKATDCSEEKKRAAAESDLFESPFTSSAESIQEMESVLAVTKIFSALLLVFLLLSCFLDFRSHAQLIPETEVRTLQQISAKLNNGYWNVSRTSCSESTDFYQYFAKDILTNVTCDCSYNVSNVCHITHIQLKGLNLTGVLPEEFADLPKLQEIDLSRNYINGTIPTSFTRIPLVFLSLLGNRISGSIPKEIGDIATLEALILEDNQLEGTFPHQLGKLSRLKRFLASANNFTGMLPEAFANLTNLTDFRIDGNVLSGKIPDFIRNWTKLTRLDMQGTSMEGPIPSTISHLKNLTELRVTDLNGPSTRFPDLREMKDMQQLVLRNCLINDLIPEYIGEMTKLKTLDLSFNSLSGVIPGSFEKLPLDYMYLTNNSLSGALPDWILSSRKHLNLAASHSSAGENSISWCLKKGLPCSKKPHYHSLFINCGGGKLKFDGNEYEEDLSRMGPSNFFFSGEKWGYSSTGVFMGKSEANYIATNTSALNSTDPDLYTTARLSPLSLMYYGLCLRKGSYKVRLHFAEIMYTDDQTFSSIGTRIFDVSIQGEKVLKDFNIVEKAEGVGKGITRDFNNVSVDGSTLEIHLYWSGKGTTAIPDRGVYGPLISAITVTPNFDPYTGLSVGAIVGIVAASIVVIVSILAFLRMKAIGLWESLNKTYGQWLGFINYEERIGLSMARCTSQYAWSYPCVASKSGYMAPEYAMRGYLTDKADVYSFGIVALEIVSGKSNTNYRPREEFVYLLDWAYVLQEQGNLLELVDPILREKYSKEEAMKMLNLALLCTNPSPTLRPSMSAVVSMLEGRIPVQVPIVKRASRNEDSRFKAFEKLSQDSRTHISSVSRNSQTQRSISMNDSWLDSSRSLLSNEEIRDHSPSSKLIPDLTDIN
ncbi:hypothetical protein HHK36_001659 [Tetracentron sinense]|uniref:non-specific serine/threonine protein kinase n=1 Tax=Tetracentron sinense TaxID=13715 RepID=A0A834ZWG0_TETSI|nr:hypothetical protein HHK36_001659 [Tetracentron sinense]